MNIKFEINFPQVTATEVRRHTKEAGKLTQKKELIHPCPSLAGKNPFSSVPMELLTVLLSYIPYDQISSSQFVCKRWHQCYKKNLKSYLRVYHYFIKAIQPIRKGFRLRSVHVKPIESFLYLGFMPSVCRVALMKIKITRDPAEMIKKMRAAGPVTQKSILRRIVVLEKGQSIDALAKKDPSIQALRNLISKADFVCIPHFSRANIRINNHDDPVLFMKNITITPLNKCLDANIVFLISEVTRKIEQEQALAASELIKDLLHENVWRESLRRCM